MRRFENLKSFRATFFEHFGRKLTHLLLPLLIFKLEYLPKSVCDDVLGANFLNNIDISEGARRESELESRGSSDSYSGRENIEGSRFKHVPKSNEPIQEYRCL